MQVNGQDGGPPRPAAGGASSRAQHVPKSLRCQGDATCDTCRPRVRGSGSPDSGSACCKTPAAIHRGEARLSTQPLQGLKRLRLKDPPETINTGSAGRVQRTAWHAPRSAHQIVATADHQASVATARVCARRRSGSTGARLGRVEGVQPGCDFRLWCFATNSASAVATRWLRETPRRSARASAEPQEVVGEWLFSCRRYAGIDSASAA